MIYMLAGNWALMLYLILNVYDWESDILKKGNLCALVGSRQKRKNPECI